MFLSSMQRSVFLFLALFVFGSSAVLAPAQKTALIAFHTQLGGSGWIVNWDLTTDPCDNTWFGITCNVALDSVTAITLPGNNLVGALPGVAVFGALPDFGSIDCSVNTISGSLDGLMTSTGLTSIVLFANQLDQPLPTTINNLSSLFMLFIYSNKIPGAIPASLGLCTNMAYLGLSFNQLTSYPDDLFLNMGGLVMLFMGTNLFAQPLPSSLGSTPVTIVGFENNLISGPIPASWSGMTSLNLLEVSDNMLTGEIPAFFSTLPIASLLVTNNLLTGNPFTVLCASTGLSVAKLSRNLFSGTIPTCVGALTSLTSLEIASNSFSGPLPAEFGSCTALEKLDISSNLITSVGGIPSQFDQLILLKIFKATNNPLGFALDGVPGVVNSGGLEPFSKLPSIAIIDVGECGITGDMAHLANNFGTAYTDIWTGVIEMNFHGNDLSGVVGGTVLGSSKLLSKLDVSSNPKLTGSAGALGNIQNFIAYGCPLLRWDNGILPTYVQVASTKAYLAVEPMQCPQFIGTDSQSRIFIVDSTYHQEALCLCDKGYFGLAPNCTIIPFSTDIPITQNAGLVSHSDADFGNQRRSTGIDTFWSFQQEFLASQMTVKLTLGPAFVDFTDVIEIYEGDDRLLGDRALLLRGSDIVNGKITGSAAALLLPAGVNTYTLPVFSKQATLAFRSRDESGVHLSFTYESNSGCDAGYHFYAPTARCEAVLPHNDAAGFGIIILSVLVVLLILIVMGIVVKNKANAVVKAASPDFCLIILFFSALLATTVIQFAVDPGTNTASCTLRAWFFGLSIIGMLSPLIVKIQRIKRIFASTDFNTIREGVTQAALLKSISIMLGAELLLLIVFTALELTETELQLIPSSSLRTGNGQVAYGCKGSTGLDIWIYVQGAYIGGVLLFCAYSAFATRTVVEKYNESQHVATAVYMILCLAVFLLPLQAVVNDNPSGALVLRGVGIAVLATSFVAAIFGPMILYLFSKQDLKHAEEMSERHKESAKESHNSKASGTTNKSGAYRPSDNLPSRFGAAPASKANSSKASGNESSNLGARRVSKQQLNNAPDSCGINMPIHKEVTDC